MASGIYNRFKAHIMKKLMDLVNDTIKVALYQNSFSFTATDTVYTATGELANGNGYTTGGAALANKSVTEGATAVFDGDDSAWAASNFSVYHVVLYDQSPCNTLICAIDLGGVQTINNGTFTVQYASSGIIRLT